MYLFVRRSIENEHKNYDVRNELRIDDVRYLFILISVGQSLSNS